MEELKSFKEYKNELEKFNSNDYQVKISKNIRRIRNDLYESTKDYYDKNHIENPYAEENIAKLIGIQSEYYRRIENFDATKPISLENLLKLMILFDVDIEEFFKD